MNGTLLGRWGKNRDMFTCNMVRMVMLKVTMGTGVLDVAAVVEPVDDDDDDDDDCCWS